MTLAELRKHIKGMGYKVSIKTFSFGRSATYIHIESGEKLTFNVGTQTQWVKWRPLQNWLRLNAQSVHDLSKSEGISGLGI